MKQEELTRLELEKIEAIHDLAAGIRKFDNDMIEIGSALLTSLNRLIASQQPAEAHGNKKIPKADDVLDQFHRGDSFEIF